MVILFYFFFVIFGHSVVNKGKYTINVKKPPERLV